MARRSNAMKKSQIDKKIIKEVNRCAHIDKSNYQRSPTLEELEVEIQELDDPSEVRTTAIVSRKPSTPAGDKPRLLRLRKQKHRQKYQSSRTSQLIKRIFHKLFTEKKNGKKDCQSLVELKESITEIIAYHNQVGQTLTVMMAELQRQIDNKH